jgi:O-antigen biosynthesis protein
MKTILIKTGKAVSALKQEGLFRGGKRVTKSFLSQFGRVGTGDILFITAGVGDSARYRAHNQKEELELHDFKCSVTVQDNPFLLRYASKFKIFIFHRTIETRKIEKLIENIKRAGKMIIFDTDDLIFDKKYIQQSNHFEKMNMLERRQYEKGAGAEILLDPYVEICTTTTSYLAKILADYGKKVFISKNKLSRKDLEITDHLLKISISKAKKDIKIGYFSGTKGHDRNFATVENVLLKILEKYPQAKLILAGPLNISEKFKWYPNQIERLMFAPRPEHFKNIVGVDINIIPLEKDSPFCEAKSELKFFEAGILAVPSIAVRNQTYQEAIADGLDGLLAGSEDEWLEKLEMLIKNKNLRKEMGQKAREKALTEYTTQNSHNEVYYAFLKSQIQSSNVE